MLEENPLEVSRRKAIKSVGGSLVGVAGATGGVSGSSSPKYVGVAYNPSTHEIVGNATGNLTEAAGQLTGSLNVNGKVVTFDNRPSFDKKRRNTENGPVGQKRYLKKIPLKGRANQHTSVKVSSTENAGMTGFIRPPKGRKLAFAVGKEQKKPTANIQEILEATKPKNTEVNK